MGELSDYQKDFNEAVEPLREWLFKYGHPRMVVIVNLEGAQVFEGICSKRFLVQD